MAYFQHHDEQQHQRVFQDRQDDSWQDENQYMYDPEGDWQEDPEEDELLDEDEMTEEERALARRDHWQVLAGIGDFLAVIVGTAVILILIALLVSLINWVHADISQSFTLWQTKI